MNRLLWLRAFLIVGMLLSAFLIVEHFSSAATKVCRLGGDFDCSTVNRSPYANADGILYWLAIDKGLPVGYPDLGSRGPILDLLSSNAFLGLLFLGALLALTYAMGKRDVLFIRKGRTLTWIRWLLAFGVLYGGYLFVVQHTLIQAYCIFCLALDVTMLASLALAWSVSPAGKL